MYACVCVCVCAYVFVYICVRVYMRVCVYVHTRVCILCLFMCVCMTAHVEALHNRGPVGRKMFYSNMHQSQESSETTIKTHNTKLIERDIRELSELISQLTQLLT